ncbi:MAG TPA: hypothetical protein VGM56_14390 [Byssovorax sp.]|jgi:hypothetical protein
MLRRALALSAAVVIASFACAKGDSLNETGFQNLSSGSFGGETGRGGHDMTMPSDTSTADVGPSTSTGDVSGAGGFGGGFGGMSTSSSMGGLGGMSTGTGTGGCDHVGPVTCNSASNLGSITGDTDSSPGPLIENGDTSAWFSVDVTEDSDFPNSLSYAASLDYPSGVVFQVFAYDGSCNAAPISGTTGTPSQLCETWDDNFGSTDDRTIYFEVRYISGGACGVSATWTLTILGHSGSNCTQG